MKKLVGHHVITVGVVRPDDTYDHDSSLSENGPAITFNRQRTPVVLNALNKCTGYSKNGSVHWLPYIADPKAEKSVELMPHLNLSAFKHDIYDVDKLNLSTYVREFQQLKDSGRFEETIKLRVQNAETILQKAYLPSFPTELADVRERYASDYNLGLVVAVTLPASTFVPIDPEETTYTGGSLSLSDEEAFAWMSSQFAKLEEQIMGFYKWKAIDGFPQVDPTPRNSGYGAAYFNIEHQIEAGIMSHATVAVEIPVFYDSGSGSYVLGQPGAQAEESEGEEELYEELLERIKDYDERLAVLVVKAKHGTLTAAELTAMKKELDDPIFNHKEYPGKIKTELTLWKSNKRSLIDELFVVDQTLARQRWEANNSELSAEDLVTKEAAEIADAKLNGGHSKWWEKALSWAKDLTSEIGSYVKTQSPTEWVKAYGGVKAIDAVDDTLGGLPNWVKFAGIGVVAYLVLK